MIFSARSPRIASSCLAFLLLACLLLASLAHAAPRSRVTRPVDLTRVKQLADGPPAKAQPQLDQGAVDSGLAMNYMMVMFKPSAEQQVDLDQLLFDQQNPSSSNYHKWLTPEEYSNRFGLNASDHSKVTAWLASQGFKIDQHARGGNWIAFSGTAGQVSAALRTPLHYFQVNGKRHFANTTAPSVPEALADVIGGFSGLHDFRVQSNAVKVDPEYNSSSGAHYLAPEDWSTIYNVSSLAANGIDGTGQSIAIVGDSDPVLSDITSFRTRFGLPTNSPKFLFYGGTDPGVNGDLLETNLDLQWAGAIAPKATIYYVFGQDAFLAAVIAIDSNIAPVLSISFGACELDFPDPSFRAFFQQGNAQGITIVSSSGDSGAASCDHGFPPFATHGPTVSVPNVFPEVTSIGGTQFAENGGNYWAAANDKVFGTALSYIPEAAWNETSQRNGITSTGGGLSQFYARPPWQQAVGLSNNLNVRYVPDISFSAAIHDAYLVIYQGSLIAVAGTSASSPSFAGALALLNHYQVSKKFQTSPGLGNINPQLYRLAQSAPSVFHDITNGDNIVPCLQATPGCINGSYGYKTGAGYDYATGLGSADINSLVTQWNTATSSANVKLSLSTSKIDVNGTVTAVATITGTGTAIPTGSVDFNMEGLPLGTVSLTVNGTTATATLTFPLYNFGFVGAAIVSATYSGDSVYTGVGATAKLTITTPTGAAGIVVNAPTSVNPSTENAQGSSWQTFFSLSEVVGVPTLVTGFSIDGVVQPLAKYFPAPAIAGGGSLNVSVVFYNLPAPVTKKFSITGTDTTGTSWLREFSVRYLPIGTGFDFLLTAAPLTPVADPSADPACQWPVKIIMTDISGKGPSVVAFMLTGGIDVTAQVASIFGTTRLSAYGALQGTVCFGGITPPATVPIFIQLDNGVFNEITVSFQPAPATPVKLTPTPATLSLSQPDVTKPAQTTFNLDVSDKTQAWNISVGPKNPTSTWLSVSPQSGVGPAQITVTASPTGLGPGAFGATLLIQSANAPQSVTVPVMFLLGGQINGTFNEIDGVANPATHKSTAAPGQLLEVYGRALANSVRTLTLTGNVLPQSADGVSATVNGYPANLLYISLTQVNIQVPYEVGAGPAVVGINNNGLIAAFPIQVVPASPGILVDSTGTIVPSATVAPGGTGTLFFTGAGDVSPQIFSGFAPSSTTSLSNLPVPLLPVSVTVGGTPAFVRFLGIPAGLVGVVQLNFVVPSSVPAGTQPVVVTVNGVASPAANIQIAATAK